MITVSQVMVKQIVPILFSKTIGEVLELLGNSSLPGLPVVDQRLRVMGVVFGDSLLAELPPLTPLVK